MNRALLVFLLSTITFVGCTAPSSHLASDAAVDASGPCDPHAGVCRATLRWVAENSDGVRLSDGEVGPCEARWDCDVGTAQGRSYSLFGRDVCRFGESAGHTTSFDRLEDIPAEESWCSRDPGSSLYWYHQVPRGGAGFLARDARDQRYRVRVAQTHFEGETLFVELEWSAL